jgi:NAD(P)-dependent dehydrogenase (short-subunit alcohol dehydrogenase family)
VAADPFSLVGKTILVTGASSGIGRQVAISCAERGAKLVISGRNPDRLNETLTSLSGVDHRAQVADLTKQSDIDALANATNSIDGLFFSAGIAVLAPFRMITIEHIRKLMQIDFEAPILVAQSLLKKKLIREGGTIVFNTSAAAHISPVGSAIYSGAKAAVNAAARSLALEAARSKIRVNCLQLGYVETGMLADLSKAGMNIEEMTGQAPLGLGTVSDAANAAIFLLSDASRWVSRSIFTADGGMSVRVT